MHPQSLVYRPPCPPAGSALLTLGLLALPACLVPLPLQQQNSVDGGQLLMFAGSDPPFGTQQATSRSFPSIYQIDVVSDSPSVAGRLYRQIDGSCCNVDITNSDRSRFSQEALVTRSAPDKNLYSVVFRSAVQPCNDVPTGSTIFIVPVVATGGFLPDPLPVPDGIGVVDRSHYWTVHCP